MSDPEKNYFETNRKLWNSRVKDHVDSKFYNVPNFRKGETSLNKIELEQMGDVKGKSLLHLQCHFGMDTLSWERLGANVTGVDLSDESILAAEKLRDEVGLKGKFICCNVYDIDQHLNEKFDIVSTTLGHAFLTCIRIDNIESPTKNENSYLGIILYAFSPHNILFTTPLSSHTFLARQKSDRQSAACFKNCN